MSVQVAFCLFHRFFHRIPTAENDLDVLIGVHLDAFHHLTDDVVIVFILVGCSFCNDPFDFGNPICVFRIFHAVFGDDLNPALEVLDGVCNLLDLGFSRFYVLTACDALVDDGDHFIIQPVDLPFQQFFFVIAPVESDGFGNRCFHECGVL